MMIGTPYLRDLAGKEVMSLVEYRLRWKVNEKDDFVQWEKPQLLGTTEILFNDYAYIRASIPYW